ncbi:putative EG45-like domain containing protein 1 isoform X5 [Nymphaea colorata]|uniref:putative EG45-like domain containing protein 1 isoform X5 n=1 Tax=Nymphaea colorata TaxID=210225 RepID=UPI00214E433A|nr:putative EG45-like domain containing protein 1 isoform X5 [Nymphaea colorata]
MGTWISHRKLSPPLPTSTQESSRSAINPFACENEQPGTMYAAVGPSTFQNRAACGRRYSVTCIGGTNAVPHPCTGRSMTVTVVDRCEGCEPGHLDLSYDAFAAIANPDAGRVRIRYHRVY